MRGTRCHEISSIEWKTLVKDHLGDEQKAFAEWEANNFLIPDRIFDKLYPNLSEDKNILTESTPRSAIAISKQQILENMRKTLAAKQRKLEHIAKGNPDFKKYSDELRKLKEDMETNEADTAILNFVEASVRMTSSAEKWLTQMEEGTKATDLYNLKRLEEFVSSLESLKELTFDLLYNDDPNSIFKGLRLNDKVDYKDPKLGNVVEATVKLVTDTHIIINVPTEDGGTKNWMITPKNIALLGLQDKSRKEANSAISLVQSLLTRHEVIKQKYLSMSTEILADTFKDKFGFVEARWKAHFQARWTKLNAKKYPNKKDREKALNKATDAYMIANAKAIDIETKEHTIKSFMTIEDIDSATSWLVDPRGINNEIISLAVDTLDTAGRRMQEDLIDVVDTTEKLYNEYIKYKGKSSRPEDQFFEIMKKNEEGKVLPELIAPKSPEHKELVAKYKGTPIMALYNHLLNLKIQTDKNLPKSYRLGLELARMEKRGFERFYEEGILKTTKNNLFDHFRAKPSDTGLGDTENMDFSEFEAKKDPNKQEVSLTEKGLERRMIPVHYRNNTLELKDRSLDPVTTTILDYQNALSFKTKTEVGLLIEIMQDVVKEAGVLQKTSLGKRKVDKDTGLDVTIKGTVKTSNVALALDSIYRHRILGIAVEGDPGVAKTAASIGRYVSFNNMALNTMSAAANIIQGNLITWIETIDSKGLYDRNSLVKAHKDVTADMINMVKDSTERTPTSKTNLLARHFALYGDNSLLNGKTYVDNNALKRLADPSSLMVLTNAGEIQMYTTLMRAILNKIKVQDAEGNYVDKDFKIVDSADKALSLTDAYSVVDGKLVLDPRVVKTDRTKDVSFEEMDKISKLVANKARELYGNYSTSNKSKFQRTTIGAMVSMMRGWLVPGIQKRWKGISNVSMGFGEEEFSRDNQHRLSYNSKTGEFEEGQYATTIRFMYSALKEVRQLKLMTFPENWSKLTEAQKGRVKKSILEIGIAVLFLSIAFGAEDDPEDPDDFNNIYLAYLSRRAYSELFTYGNPLEAIRTIKSPAIAIGTVEDTFKALLQLTDPMAEYESGRHAGESQLGRKWGKLVPIYKQYTRNIEDSYLFLTK